MKRQPGYTVVFDLDGTLVHTAPDIAAALNAALEPIALRRLSLDETERLIGNGLDAAFESALRLLALDLTGERCEQARTAFMAAYAAAPAALSRAYPDMLEVIADLQARGVRLALCTNKDERIAVEILERVGIARAFDSIVGHVDGRARKPSPAPLLEAIELAGGLPDRAIMVGDSAVDRATAHAAGILVILMEHGYSREPVQSLGADLCVADGRELRSVLSSYLSARDSSC